MTYHDSNLADRVAAAIQERDISPRPRWEFAAWNVVYAALAIFTVFLGAVTIATSAHLLASRDWDVSLEAGERNLVFAVQTLPVLWVAALGVLVAATYSAFTRTRRGYRFAPVTVLGGAVLASLALGSGLYVAGAGYQAHELARTSVPAYERLVLAPEQMWLHPEAGFLAGLVASAHSSSSFVLDDGRGMLWWVEVPAGSSVLAELEPGARVRIIGTQEAPGSFVAHSVRPWQGAPSRFASSALPVAE